MQTKVQRDTNVVISLSGEEASELMALLNLPKRGVLPIADDIFDAMSEENILYNMEAHDALDAHLVEVYGDTE